MQTKRLLASIKGKRETGETTLFGLTWLEITFAIFCALVVATVMTDERLALIYAKVRHVPPQIVVVEQGDLVVVRVANTAHPLVSTQLESFEFVWKANNPKEKLVEVMRDGQFVLYRAKKL